MLSCFVLAVLGMLILAAVMDLRDSRSGHTRRSSGVIATERRDMAADLQSTQHHGICVPIDDICRDRQRHR